MLKSMWHWMMSIIRRVISATFYLAGWELTDEHWNVLEQFIGFLFVGLSNTVVLLSFYYVVILLGGREAYLYGQTLGYIAGIVNSYFWNSRYVFSGQKKRNHSFIRMCLCYAATYVMQMGLLYLSVDVLSLSEVIAPIIAVVITTPVNFALNRVFAF